MRKLFLTSGLVLCMASNALAVTDINTSGSNASCINDTLDTYSGSTSFQAKWNANISGSITLNSNRWASSDAGTAIQTATTVAAPTPLYSVYGKGMYSSSSEAAARSNNTISAITTAPAMTGYDFQGFYTGKAGSGTKVINSDKSFATGAENVISSTGGEAIWYAHWSAKVLNLTYTCGTAPTVSGLTIATTGSAPAATTATYDGSKAIESTPNTCALTGDRGGYHFSGWNCTVDPDDNSGIGVYDAAYDTNSSAWRVSKTVNPWKATTDVTCNAVWGGNTYTVSYATGTAGSRTTGFSGTMGSTNIAFGDTKATTANAFSIPGYSFTGWSGNYDNASGSEAATAYTDGYTFSPYKIAHNLTLTAQWAPNIYTITLKNYNNTATHSTIYEKYDTGWYSDSTAATTLNAASVPTRDGFTFRGFYTATQADVNANSSSSGTQRITKAGGLPANSTFTADTPLYAAWAQNCAAGTGCNCSLNVTDAGIATYTTSAKTGYSLTSNDGKYNPGCTPNVYKLTLNQNGGTGGHAEVYEKYATGWSLTNYGTEVTNLTNAPTRDKYTFRGYYAEQVADISANGNTGTQKITADLKLPSNTSIANDTTTLYAAWAKNCEAGTGCECSLEVKNDGDVKYTTTNKTGYTLASGNNTYAPVCNANTYTITLTEPNGTTGGMGTIKEVYATKWTNSAGTDITGATVPTRSGYTFRGYYTQSQTDLTASGGSGTRKITAAGGLPANTTYTADTTLYSAWAKNCTVPTYNNTDVGTCNLSIGNDGTATYTASCNNGFTVGSSTTATPTCTPNIYEIALDDNGGSGGNGIIYEKYATNWYTTSAATTVLAKATVPTRSGYKFRGYYSTKQNDLSSSGGTGTRKIDAGGNLPSASTYTEGTKLFAAWAKECTTPAHGSCTTTVNDDGTVAYSASCDTGYTVSDATTATPSCTADCNKITLDANTGTAGSLTVLYKKTDATGWYSNDKCTTAWTSDAHAVPTLAGKVFRGFYTTQKDPVSSDNNTDKAVIGKSGATTTEGTAWTVNAPKTIYAAWAADCSSVSHGSCELTIGDFGQVDYTTSCNTGYTISGNNTATPSCGADCNAITLNANGGTANSVTTLYKKTDATGWYSNSTCTTAWTSNANVVPTRSNFAFRGFYSADLDDVSSDNSGGTQYITTAGATNTTGTNWTVNAPKTVYAAWAANCVEPAHGTCSLNVSTAGAADYTTSCVTGYSLSGNNTSAPNCTAKKHTVSYECGLKPGSEPLTCSGTSGCTATAPTSTEFTYDAGYTLPGNAGTCQYNGWTFSGWNCNYVLTTGAEAPTYNNSYGIGGTGTFKVDNDVTCRAQWSRNQISVSWDIGTGATAGSTPGSTSCFYDSTLVVPSAPSRTGYTFAGWTVQPCLNDYACGLSSSLLDTNGSTVGYYNYNQSEVSNQNVSTYSLSAGGWATSFSHGTVKGIAACSNTGASVYDNSVYKGLPSEGSQEAAVWGSCSSDAIKPSNTFSTSNNSGSHCWCKVTNYTATGGSACATGSKWVLAQTWENGPAHCPSQCAKVCAEAVRDRSVLRNALFGTTGL